MQVKSELSIQESIAAVAAGGWLLDVREQFEWDSVHVPGVHHIPLGELNARQDELPQDETIYVVCHTGGRSRMVTDALLQADYSVFNVAGGMDSWQAAGGPTASADRR